jgi:hypothetical protein
MKLMMKKMMTMTLRMLRMVRNMKIDKMVMSLFAGKEIS